MNSTTLPEPPTGGAPSPQPASTGPSHALAAARQRLQQQRQRARNGIWIETLGVVLMLLVAYAIPTLVTDRLLRLETAFRAILLATFAFAVGRVVVRRLVRPLEVQLSDEEMALAVERRSPELDQALISSLQFEQELQQGDRHRESAELKAAVVQQVVDRINALPFGRAIDARRVRRFGAAIALSLACFVGWGVVHADSLGLWARRNLFLSNVDWPRYTTLSFVDAGGEVRLPQGDALTVRVATHGEQVDQVFVDYRFQSGDVGTEPMSRTGDEEFTWTLDAVLEDVTLSVQGGDSLPVELKIVIVERPHVEDLQVRVTLPAYMEREPFDVPATEGELRLPAGASLSIAGKSQKPLQSAFLLVGNDEKVSMTLGADKRSFTGAYSPTASGLMIVDVIDEDRLGAGAPPKLLLRVGDDKPPTIELRLRGIGSSITAHARIPSQLRVRDDFGLREVRCVYRVTDDQPQRGDEGSPLPELPWESAMPTFVPSLERSALRYESEANVDLTTWNKVAEENSRENPIRPGMLFSMRFSALDNFGPGDPHEGMGEVMTFRVVTRDMLVEELRRRQVEQRVELQRIADDEQTATYEVAETLNPSKATTEADTRKAAALLKALSRRQQALGSQVRSVGEAYQRILWEYENNRLIEANKVRQIESLITVPLEVLAKDAFPATSRLVDRFQATGDEAIRAEAVEGYRDIQRKLQAVLKEMEQAENLAALLEELRNVINLEKDAIRDVQKRVKDREDSLFQKKPDTPKVEPPKKGD
ncbi:MAG: hypothetical protein R3F29_05040 [Planctomycetota bacterium]